jgi:hypothetical protein
MSTATNPMIIPLGPRATASGTHNNITDDMAVASGGW